MIIRSDWRGEPRNTSAPKRAISKREADIDIISMAQQARPKLMGQIDDLRAQFTTLSSRVKMRPSSPDASFTSMVAVLISIRLCHAAISFSIPAAKPLNGIRKWRVAGGYG